MGSMLLASLILFRIVSISCFDMGKHSRGLSIFRNSNEIKLLGQASGRNLELEVPGGKILFDFFSANKESQPSVVYLPGLNRPKNEAKFSNLQSWCRKQNFNFLCADYFGVGRSSGTFQDGSVGRWAADTVSLIDKVFSDQSSEKIVLVGHGVGAWISFLVAAKKPDVIAGIVGMAADPDFTEELLWKKLPEEVKTKIMTEGISEITWGKEKYPISKTLIEDGRRNLLLQGGPGSISVVCPVRLIHAFNDEEVPYKLAMQLAENCKSSDVNVVLIKDSSHSMENEQDMKTMRSMILEVLEAFNGDFDLRSPASG